MRFVNWLIPSPSSFFLINLLSGDVKNSRPSTRAPPMATPNRRREIRSGLTQKLRRKERQNKS
jgi:hypothetical protein